MEDIERALSEGPFDKMPKDFSVDIVMESKGMITTDGWTLEVAIPFKSLRYEAGKGKLWGIHIWRNIDRFNDEIDSWMPNSRDISSLLSQAGHITGLDGVSTEHTLEIIPSMTVSKSGRPTTRICMQTGRPWSLAYCQTGNATSSAKNVSCSAWVEPEVKMRMPVRDRKSVV